MLVGGSVKVRRAMLVGHETSDGSERAPVIWWPCLCVSLTGIRRPQPQ